MSKAKFITIEGIEGVGKTTNLEFVRNWLEAAGIDVRVTREPGGTPLGEAIRGLLLDTRYTGMDPACELQLMFAARAEHLASLVWPALKQGQWVLCDRFTDATYAYQGSGRGIDVGKIAQLEQWVQGDFRPDVTLLLDVPVEVGLARASERGALDRFEQEKVEFFENVRQGYLALAKRYAGRYRVIDASLPLDQVQQQLADTLKSLLGTCRI